MVVVVVVVALAGARARGRVLRVPMAAGHALGLALGVAHPMRSVVQECRVVDLCPFIAARFRLVLLFAFDVCFSLPIRGMHVAMRGTRGWGCGFRGVRSVLAYKSMLGLRCRVVFVSLLW